jgi:hypothetical protein
MRNVISNSDGALPFVGSVSLRERGPIPLCLAVLYRRIYRWLAECGFNLTDELLRLDRFKRGTVPPTGSGSHLAAVSPTVASADNEHSSVPQQ